MRGKQKICRAEGGSRPPRAAKPAKSWLPPRVGALKINVDGAFIIESGAAAVGVVIRDEAGQLVLMACRKVYHCRDAEGVEALACLEGARMAARWFDQEYILEGDCSLVIEKLKAGGMDRSTVAPIIRDTMKEGALLRSLAFDKAGREQNKVST